MESDKYISKRKEMEKGQKFESVFHLPRKLQTGLFKPIQEILKL